MPAKLEALRRKPALFGSSSALDSEAPPSPALSFQSRRPHPSPSLPTTITVGRLYQSLLRKSTPPLWFEDPKPATESLSIRLLVTDVSDKMNAHVFRAEIPAEILNGLDSPLDGMGGLV
ncbi:hypothetical protein FPRO05_14092 [Fusarium proliferatum]|uniref:Uncharacterized protein n=1 Tax=Gibberella intermedia TaxID=948311 RepID=A0A365MWB2_GIBIN|nr:hypothetical protein FPRO05_14092 [Fusarium proliferatum]